jgi:hypothetical protein
VFLRRLPPHKRSPSAVASLLASLVDHAWNAAGVSAAARNSASVLVLLNLVSPLLQTLQSRGTRRPHTGFRVCMCHRHLCTERDEWDRENRCRSDQHFLHFNILQLILHLGSALNVWSLPQFGAVVGPTPVMHLTQPQPLAHAHPSIQPGCSPFRQSCSACSCFQWHVSSACATGICTPHARNGTVRTDAAAAISAFFIRCPLAFRCLRLGVFQ